MPFLTDYPGSIVVEAHPTNYYTPEGHNNVPNSPRGFVLHTPEEPADNYESTPVWFQGANRQASTHYYSDNDGDVYQLVPERCAAIANGVLGKPYPAWANPATSLNWQSLSVEIEGYAASIQNSLIIGGPQWKSLLSLISHRARHWGFPTDRAHIIGHYQVSNQRSDPGALFPWDALIRDLNGTSQGDRDDVYHQHDVYALKGIWTNTVTIPGGATQALNARFDFNLPADARAVQLEFLCRRGYFVAYNGDGSVAGRVGWGTPADWPTYGSLRINLNEEGWLALRALDVNNPVEFTAVHAVGYWT